MLYCNNCDTELLLDLRENLHIMTKISMSNEEIFPGIGEVVLTNDKNMTFYCPSCKTNIKLHNIHSHCNQCGKTLPVTEIFKVKNAGGVYCSTCITKLKTAIKGNSIDTIIKNFKLQGDIR